MPIYELAATLPECERYDLCDQLRRTCKSVVANIVEGYGYKATPAKMKNFWRISMGSTNEIIEHLEQTIILKYATLDVVQPLIDEYTIIAKQLNKLIQNWH